MAATKQRYSDFIVREVGLDGKVVRLTALPEVPAAPDAPPVLDPAALHEKVAALLGKDQAAAVLALHQAAATANEQQTLVLERDDDKDHRRDVHRLVKELLSPLASDTVDVSDYGKAVSAECGKAVRLMTPKAVKQHTKDQQQRSGGGKRKRGADVRVEWPAEAAGKLYLGFTLYKENKDTTECMSKLARILGMNPNALQFAGTKDKRGVTTQRVNAHRLLPSKLAHAMAKHPFGDQIVVGNLSFEDRPLRLGQHGGNRFTIVLRDVSGTGEAELEAALAALDATGFINYFGLQRFGNSEAFATHRLGIGLLKNDYQQVLEMILAPREGERPDERAVRDVWTSTQDAAAALKILPRHMSVERSVLEGIARHGKTDAQACLMRIPRSLRSMYLHAFQSLVFNHAATERVRLYGVKKAVSGDLVWGASGAPTSFDQIDSAQVGGSEDSTVEPEPEPPAAASGSGHTDGGGAPTTGPVAGPVEEFAAESGSGSADFVPHVVTAEEEANGTYSIEEVLLPLPGHKILFPANDVQHEYTRRLAEHGLTIDCLARGSGGLSLPGSYRRLLQRPQQMKWRILKYTDPNLPLAVTDLMTLRGEPEPEGTPGGTRTAVRLEFTLPSSTYATMCLRELTKQSTELSHQKKLNVTSGSAASDSAGAKPAAELEKEKADA